MDGLVRVRLTRSCELRLAGKIYHMGDELVVDEETLAKLGDLVQRIEEPGPAPALADEAAPAEPKKRAKK